MLRIIEKPAAQQVNMTSRNQPKYVGAINTAETTTRTVCVINLSARTAGETYVSQ